MILTLKHVENFHNFSQKTARDGGWTEWGEWGSLCNVNCSVTRNRTCTNPTPLFGGSDCQGDEVEESSETCYGGDCCPGINFNISDNVSNVILEVAEDFGCFNNSLPMEPYSTVNFKMKPCFCIGYCLSLPEEFSLAMILGFVILNSKRSFQKN